MDRADAGGPRKRVERKQVVQPDRQGQHRKNPSTGMGKGAKTNAGACGVDGITIGRFEQRQPKPAARRERAPQARAPINPSRSNGCGLTNRAARKSGRWEYPTVTDRVVQAAVRMVIEPIFENRFAKHSYGFRPGRGCKDALRRVEELLRAGRHARRGRGHQGLLRCDSP